MYRRIGNLSVATKGINAGVYYQPTPYRSWFVGLDWPNGLRWFGKSRTPGVKAFVAGPLVFGRYDLQDALSVGAK